MGIRLCSGKMIMESICTHLNIRKRTCDEGSCLTNKKNFVEIDGMGGIDGAS